MENIKFNKDEIIFKAGDFADCMFDIEWGSVGIYADFGENSQKLLTVLHADEFFGEMGLIDALPRSATAVSLEKGTICRKINIDDFSGFVKEKPAKLITILQHTGDRLRKLSEDYIEACRTIAEYVELEKANQPKSESLIEKMKKFVLVGKKK